ncbi:molecular chaperone GroES [Kurthia sp. 3B1D]|uniref:Co-chaperonin GroES n=2 Tax=Kurthia TaxID=1649 RepID=A0A433RX03_9BACL|nr:MULTISPECIES: co-chaperone GroES [unclassified Kurthia]RUS57814.1 molecular chaperone GroES [Kurthia sp. 3B1D]HIX43513.1 co-chaperone GroES [Candidatus Kurthia intestinigallinarum]
MLKPLGKRIIIEVVEVEEKSAFGIVLPDSAKEKPQQGKVLATGSGVTFDVKEGDDVVFAKYAGTEVTYGDTAYLVLSEEDILAVIE